MLQNAQTLALQLEKVKDKIESFFLKPEKNSLLSLIQKRTDVEVTSSRSLRLPIAVAPSGGIKQVSLDGSSMGRGNGTQFDVATASPIAFSMPFEYSRLAEDSTDSKGKAISDVAKTMVTEAIAQMKTGLEQLLNTAGDAVLDTVVSVSTNTLTVANASGFVANQTIQVFPSLGGTSRGSATITATDPIAKTITLNAAPASTAAGDLLVLDGAAGTAGTSLYGIEYVNSAATTGTYLGLSRSTYGVLRTPHLAASNADLTGAMVRQLMTYLKRKSGSEAGENSVWHANTDVTDAWSNLATAVSEIITNQVSGDSTTDILKKHTSKQIAGRPVVESVYAQPGRLDLLDLSTWGRAEMTPVKLYEVGGQSLFPSYASDGAVESSTQGWIYTAFQVWCQNPLKNAFIDGIKIDSGY